MCCRRNRQIRIRKLPFNFAFQWSIGLSVYQLSYSIAVNFQTEKNLKKYSEIKSAPNQSFESLTGISQLIRIY